jgi:TRAP-type uncharacterized transport system fused permease subunit
MHNERMGAAAFVMSEFTGIPYWQICVSAALTAVISYFGLLVLSTVRESGLR